MSALIRCYWDEECTNEIFMDVKSYGITLGPKTGLNGDRGEITNQFIYLKNVGDVTAQNVVLKETGDLQNYFKVSTPLEEYKIVQAAVGSIEPNAVVPIVLHSIIPKHTKKETGILRYTIEYYTFPGVVTAPELSPYTQPPHKLVYKGDNPIPSDAKAGRPYGAEPYYNDLLWGQEGLIKKRVVVDSVLPIAGLKYAYITADYTITSRYDGTEASIEDVQSFYTEDYMALECFDGPALPLWLNKYDEDIL